MNDYISRRNRTLSEWLAYCDFDANILWIGEDITHFECDTWMQQLSEFQRRSPEVLTININSNGGDAYAAFGLYDMIMELRESGVFVKMIARGVAASAAAMILLQAADERLATPNTRFLLHEVHEWAFFSNDSTSELEDRVAEMQILTDKIVKILAEKCNQDEKIVRELIKRKEIWMNAEEAKEWRLIDEIL